MGDFNWSSSELTQLRRLESLGFKDLQVIANEWWGVDIQPTGKGDRVLDYVYVSPELFPLIANVIIDPTQWPDHSSVMGRFRGGFNNLRELRWRVPSKVDWPDGDWIQNLPLPSGDVSKDFAECWQSLEAQANKFHVDRGKAPWHASQFGRGQTLDTVEFTPPRAPVKKGRSGESQPQFFGGSWRYAQRYRQLRRFHCLVRSLRKHPNCVPASLWQLWKAIRWSSGYSQGFCGWWQSCGIPLIAQLELSQREGLRIASAPTVAPGSAEEASWDGSLGCNMAMMTIRPSPPDLTLAELMLQVVQHDVRCLEKSLIKTRYAHSKQLRASELKYIFQDCAKDSPEPVAMLHSNQVAEIDCVAPDLGRIYLREFVPFQLGVPLVVQGKSFTLNSQKDLTLELREVIPDDLEGTIRQTVVKAAVPDILDSFRSEWAPRWQRAEQVQSSQWGQVLEFVKHRMPRSTWFFPAWTSEDFRAIVKHKKSQAAVGTDGITRSDLLALPDCAVQRMIDFFQSAETRAVWPHQMTVGMVNCLEKTPGTLEVTGFRPIVIYPLLYRVWSSFRARQLLKQFLAIAPSGLKGGLPGCQAKSIWYDIAVRLESAHFEHGMVIGIVADLVKAFNAIPRLEVYELLDHLGLPAWFIRSWGAFVAMQTRRFKIRGSLGQGIQSNSGFPEGCGLSVCAMAVIDFALDLWLQGMQCSPLVYTFVDDWQILHSHPEFHDSILERLQFFVSALRMDLDCKKSFVWGSSSQARKILRDGQLDVFDHSRNLGAHANYTRRCGNKVLVDRLSDMPKTWKCFRASIASYDKKCIALRMLAWPRAFHGVSVVRLGKSHFETSRTAALRGLRCDRVGANPILHLSAIGFTFDPEGWSLLQTFKDAREFGDPDHFKHLLIQSFQNRASIPMNGPVAILRDRAESLGWSVSQNGAFVDEIGVLDLFDISIGALQQRLAWSWPALMAREVAHRQTFDGIQWADLGEARVLLSSFSQSDRVYLRCAMDGTMYTQHGRQHWQTCEAHLCPWCKAPDSFAHRLWECKFFESSRQELATGVQNVVSHLPGCLSNHGWPVRTEAQLAFQKCLAMIPELEPDVYQMDQCVGSCHDFFIDGACLMPKDKTCRIAAFAVTVAQPWISTWEHSLLVAGHVPGLLQTPFRAELWALYHAVVAASIVSGTVRVWTDCGGVFDKVNFFQKSGQHVKVNQQHADLWGRIVTLLRVIGPRISFHKVVSHISPALAGCDVEQWAFWHNGLVDRAASAINDRRTDAFKAVWETCCKVVQAQRSVSLDIAKHIVRVGKLANEQRHGEGVTERQAACDAKYGSQQNNLQIPEVVTIPRAFGLKFGTVFSQVLLQWWLQTGHVFLKRECRLKWISFTQLFCDFLMATGHHGTWLIQGKWGVDPSSVSADMVPHFGQRSRWFQMALKAFWSGCNIPIAAKLQRPSSATLACWQSSALLVWDKKRLNLIDEVLHARLGLVSKSISLEKLGHIDVLAEMAISSG